MQNEAKCFKEIFPSVLINQNFFFFLILGLFHFAISPYCFAFIHFIVYLLFLFMDNIYSESSASPYTDGILTIFCVLYVILDV